MKSYNGDLTILSSEKCVRAGLYTFTLVDGTTLNYTSADTDVYVSWASTTFSAGKSVGPYLDRTDNKAKAHWKVGVEVDTLVFDVLPGAAQIEGIAFLSAVQQGIFDGAELTYSLAFWNQQAYSPLITAGLYVPSIFVGRVAEVDAGRSIATFTINSHLELLNQNMPRNLYQSGCVNTLYDPSCTLLKSTYAVSATAASGSTKSIINATIANATGYFDLGSMKFTSGVNSGLSRGVKTYVNGSPGTISLMQPFPNAPAATDAFTIYPGCDKTQATCTNKFSNLANFRGFPYIPDNSTAA